MVEPQHVDEVVIGSQLLDRPSGALIIRSHERSRIDQGKVLLPQAQTYPDSPASYERTVTLETPNGPVPVGRDHAPPEAPNCASAKLKSRNGAYDQQLL
jgi:hypothetical protein